MENLPEGVPWDPATNPPLGPLVDATPRPLPARIPHKGQSVDLEPLHIRHAEDLWRAAERDTSGDSWAYMGYGPFKDAAAMRAHGEGEGEGAALPVGVEDGLVALGRDGPEAMHAAEVVAAIHGASAFVTPIIASRVTRPARRSSLQPSVPAGRSGRTR